MFKPLSWSSKSFVRTRIRQLLASVLGLVAIWGFVHLIFYAFPLVFRMASNADSLVMLDFARDLLMGHSITYWNLPRVPYLFPDAVIALGVMRLGWMNPFSFYLIGMLHCVLLIAVARVALRGAVDLERLSYWQTGILLSLSLLTIGLTLPSSFATLYWQLFASGAHFLSVMVVLAMLLLSERWQRTPSIAILVFLFVLGVAEGLSNSLATLLLLIWCAAQYLTRRFYNAPLRADLAVVFVAVVIGTLLSTQIPRQSLVDSFFSLDKFLLAFHAFVAWLWNAPSHWALIGVLLLGVLAYPYLMLNQWPKRFIGIGPLIRSPVFLPSVGVILLTPLFFQEAGSIRYLAFPGLITLLSLSMLYGRLWQKLTHHAARYGFALCIILSLGGLAGWQAKRGLIGPQMPLLQGKDMVGLASGAQTDLALACLMQAKKQVPLADGIATYWNARPTRFASQFEHFFAQINPWRPRSGYMVWGNNPIDFVYRDLDTKTPRQYNFILATDDEINNRLWGSLPSLANQTIICQTHRIFYFNDGDLLWNFLFPLDVPYGYRAPTSALTPSVHGDRLQTQGARIFPADDFFSVIGKRDGVQLQATGKAGVLAYGPYIPLRAGRYQLIARGHLYQADGANAVLDVSTQFGKTVITKTVFPLRKNATMNEKTAEIAQLEFTLEQTTQDVEFRLQIPDGTHGTLTEFVLQRLD